MGVTARVATVVFYALAIAGYVVVGVTGQRWPLSFATVCLVFGIVVWVGTFLKEGGGRDDR